MMTAEELKMAAWEMDATASAMIANLERIYKYPAPDELADIAGPLADIAGQIEDEIASLQAYAHALQAYAAKEGAA